MLNRRFIRILLYVIAGSLAIMVLIYIYYRVSANVREPEIPVEQMPATGRIGTGPDEFSCEHGWLRKARNGWWQMYLEGSPFDVGYAHGLLSKELMAAQENAFLSRLEEIIPSAFYQKFMLAFVRFFNRDLEEYVLPEYQEEIFGISRFASPEFDFMGPAYARMLNYHAAHDIGHAMQNMNLVACTAFGAWDARSADSSLILGRNFDFYVSEEFAKDKILCFVRPDSGYGFVMVTWAGFCGVVSGMNEKGLTITLNAAKSSIPLGAKTPVSLLGREILQYASNIAEAYAIAHKRKTFVTESFMVGSAADHKAVVIEKSPEKIVLYDPNANYLIVTNHFQSETFLTDPLNIENMENETSVYRFKRVEELLLSHPPVDPSVAARILRDYKGIDNKNIGLGNEKAVNQFIAHHSIIFKPEEKKLWIAGPPWQLGEYWGYDLDLVFGITRDNVEDFFDSPSIPLDSTLATQTYQKLLKFKSLSRKLEQGEYREGDADSLVLYNPEFFQTYRILGDYFNSRGERQRAAEYYRKALEKEAPSEEERKSAVDGQRSAARK